jgi:hypothetical protein
LLEIKIEEEYFSLYQESVDDKILPYCCFWMTKSVNYKNGWTVFDKILQSQFSYILVQLFLRCYLRTCVWSCRYMNVWEKTWDKTVHEVQSWWSCGTKTVFVSHFLDLCNFIC